MVLYLHFYKKCFKRLMNKMSDVNGAASVSYYSCVKALETMKMLVFGNLLSRLTVFPFFVPEGKQERDS